VSQISISAAVCVAHDRGGVIGENAGQDRQVAGQIVHRAGEFADRWWPFESE